MFCANSLRRSTSLAVRALTVLGTLALAAVATAQTPPYIGYVYPAGGQQGTTFRIKLGGQNLDGASGLDISGKGVTGKVITYLRRLGPQEMTLLREQLDELSKEIPKKNWEMLTQATEMTDPNDDSDLAMISQEMLSRIGALGVASSRSALDPEKLGIDPKIVSMTTRIRSRIADYVQRPASVAIASLVLGEITIAPDAAPGKRELRVVGSRGATNPMVFYVGQLPEISRQPMLISEVQVLGKEALALRRRRHNDLERRVTVPCTMNGQIASGEVHRYRFMGQKGQRLVISTAARELVPFIADAVPGWFQPVLAVYDAQGKELAYNDDFSFNPDPVIMFEVPKTGEYVLAICDAIYRGREDFVYRVTMNETPLITSIFPLGARFGTSPPIAMKGWNLEGATLSRPTEDSETGAFVLKATKSRWESNRVLFAPDTLRECLDKETNDDVARAQKLDFPIIVNGRIDRPDDWDVFQFTGRAGEKVVAEVKARRLGSPLDSVVKITDAQGKLLAMNDDYEDPEAGTGTHYADSYLMLTLPADGTYYAHIGDTTRNGSEEHGYRLRISAPRPDFALRVMPSSVSLRSGGGDSVTVFAYRKDGFDGPIQVSVRNPPAGISASGTVLNNGDLTSKMTIRADGNAQPGLYTVAIEGTAKIGNEEVTWEAAPAEDRMQAFLWRHLVPAKEFKAYVIDPTDESASRPRARRKPKTETPPPAPTPPKPGEKPKFTAAQVAGRLRQLELLFDEGLLTEKFYRERVAECNAVE